VDHKKGIREKKKRGHIEKRRRRNSLLPKGSHHHGKGKGGLIITEGAGTGFGYSGKTRRHPKKKRGGGGKINRDKKPP